MTDVDGVWERLKARSALQIRERKNAAALKGTNSSRGRLKGEGGAGWSQRGSQSDAGSDVQSLERLVQMLGERSDSMTMHHLDQIQKLLLVGSDEDRRQQLMEDLGRKLLVLVADGTDNTKIKAGQILLHLLPSGNGSIARALVHCAMPLLQERLSVIQSTTPKYVEMCEEVRLIAVKIVDVLLRTLGEEIRAHMDAVHCVFAQGCSDPYSEVTVAACDIAFHLCEIFGARLQHVAREFVAEIAPLTCHRQRRVRIVAIKTLGYLMQCGAHEMILELVAFHNPNILSLKEVYGNAPKRNFLGTLATDDCPAVRLAFLEMVGDWLLNLPERLDYASRLLPFILSALTDDIPSVVQRGLELLSLIGDQYQKDHEKELTEKARYLPEEAQGAGWGNFDEFWRSEPA